MLTCAFGTRWLLCVRAGGCRKCRAEVHEGCRRFAMDVLLGKYDLDGYTPNERKLQAARKQAA